VWLGWDHWLLPRGAPWGSLNPVSLTALLQTQLRSHLHSINSADTPVLAPTDRGTVPALSTQSVGACCIPPCCTHKAAEKLGPLAGLGPVSRLRVWAELHAREAAVAKACSALFYTQALAKKNFSLKKFFLAFAIAIFPTSTKTD